MSAPASPETGPGAGGWRKATPVRVGLACALILLALHPGCLFFPAYWDTALGCLHEATWLARHHFDFAALAHEAPYNAGGPRIYLLTLWPSLHALLLNTLGPGRAFLCVAHLITLLSCATVLGSVWAILRRRAGAEAAWIGTLVLWSLPPWQTQSVLINMDMPALALAYAGVALALHDRPWCATLSLLLAMCVKVSAAVPALLLGGGLLLQIRGARQIPWLLASAAPLALNKLMGLAYARMPLPLVGDGHGFVAQSLLLPWRYRYCILLLWNRCPEVVLLMGAGALGSLGWLAALWREKRAPGWRAAWEARAKSALPLMCLAAVAATAMFCAAFDIFPPRYALVTAPFAAMGFAGGVSRLRVTARRGLTAAMAVSLLAGMRGAPAHALSGGAPFSGQEGAMRQFLRFEEAGNDGHILERSFEFQEDLRLQMRAARELPARFPGKIIVTSWPLVHALRLPELGYVETPHAVMTTTRPALAWDGVENYWSYIREHKSEHRPDDFIWVWQPSVFAGPEPDRRNAVVLEELREGPHRLLVFRYDEWPAEPDDPPRAAASKGRPSATDQERLRPMK